MRLRILCVGRRARDPLLDAAEVYLGRLEHYLPVELTRLRERGAAAEGTDISNRLGPKRPDARVVALDERGRGLTSPGLAAQLRRWAQERVTEVSFVIGGDEGLAPEVRARADFVLTLSPMTLPHRLALTTLCEQLYRAQTILRGEPYHRA